MKFYSPLRYPGGKNKLAKFISLLCEKNNLNGHYIEPYAGGASVALHLLLNGYVKEITINDYDKAIYAFWYSILNDTEKFCRELKKVDITVENWKKFRSVYLRKENQSLFELGLATFFLNRTNRSGILNGGIIGGIGQKSKYKIDCRFNKENLITKIKTIAAHKSNIHLFNLDAIELIRKIQEKNINQNTIFYFDPPYYSKGPSLYMNYYEKEDHEKVSKEIQKIQNAQWVVSYDNTPEIKKLYAGVKKKEYLIYHTAYKTRVGKEILFFSNRLLIPRTLNPLKT